VSASAIGNSRANREPYNAPYVWSISLVAALGGLMFGYDWIVISGAKPFYERFFQLQTASDTGWAISSALVGCLLGALVAGGLSDKFGRKRLLILAALLFAVSSIGTALAASFVAFNLWRIAGGMAIGMASNLSPIYIAEISPASVRGRLVSVNQLAIILGIVLAQTVNYFVSQYGLRMDQHVVAARPEPTQPLDLKRVADDLAWQAPLEERTEFVKEFERLAVEQANKADCAAVRSIVAKLNEGRKEGKTKIELLAVELACRQSRSWNVATGWSWMFGVTTVPAIIFFLLMFFVPESPRWLAKNGKPEQARAILARVGGEAHAEQELAAIEQTLVGETERVDFRELLEPRLLRIVLLGVTLAFLQQWCGMNTIFYYASDIFRTAGYNLSDAMLNIVIIGSVNLVFTVLAICSVEGLGRRPLMLLGFGGIGLLHALIGTSYLCHLTGTPMLLLCMAAMACYAYTSAPMTWVVLSEIFPNRIRGAAMSVSVFALWTGCFTLTYSFPHLNGWLGAGKTFWIYALICMAGFVFVYHRLPETKGKSLEQLEQELTR
jgi:MFS family permease